MPRYAITERAGPFVAAHRNTGVGTVLELSERQAEHELRLGTLIALPVGTGRTIEPSGEAMSASAPEMPEADLTPTVPDIEVEPLPARTSKRSTL